MDYVIGENPCKRCRSRGRDRTGDNFIFYGEGLGGHCFSCGYTIPSDEHKKESNPEPEEEDYEIMTRERLTPEEAEQIKTYTGTKGHNYRGIRDEAVSYTHLTLPTNREV